MPYTQVGALVNRPERYMIHHQFLTYLPIEYTNEP